VAENQGLCLQSCNSDNDTQCRVGWVLDGVLAFLTRRQIPISRQKPKTVDRNRGRTPD
jgi:hypothetical protein